MDLTNIFQGISFGRKQTVGIMSVIPLIGEDCNIELANFEDIKFDGTVVYGSMRFINTSDKPFIIPTGYDMLTKQEAQDHALPVATLLTGNNVDIFNWACCIQADQCGYIEGAKVKEEFSILPLFIRKRQWQNLFSREVDGIKSYPYNMIGFSRLWDFISEFQSKLLKERSSNLIEFFNKYISELIHFNAEFELVDNQRGAIILINNKIVGIEIAPNTRYWAVIWDKLIRDCYGSEVLRITKGNLAGTFEDSLSNDLDISKCQTLNEIKDKMEQHKKEQYEKDRKTAEDFISKEMTPSKSQDTLMENNSRKDLKYNLFKLGKQEAYGEAFTDGNDNIVYCSIIA